MARTYEQGIEELRSRIDEADAVLVGAGAGLSTAAGFTYTGKRFERHFGDFIQKYGFTDLYSAGFYPFETLEERWALWSRHIWYNRYVDPPKDTYTKLLRLVESKDHFAITTNVDHCFQKAGWDKSKLFYTQGDYGLWQCSVPCHHKTYDNYEVVKLMVEQQRNMRVPTELVPRCPRCNEPMSMNLRADATFVQDDGWYAAANRYEDFLATRMDKRIVYLELGVGGNTPAIIKYPFWKLTASNPNATYACLNLGEAVVPGQIASQSIAIDADVDQTLTDLLAQ